MLAVLATPTFAKAVKKLHLKDRDIVDDAVHAIAATPLLGDEKKGDLTEVFVYKFKLNKQEVLLAYRLTPDKFKPDTLVLLSLGAHENFYVKLKRGSA